MSTSSLDSEIAALFACFNHGILQQAGDGFPIDPVLAVYCYFFVAPARWLLNLAMEQVPSAKEGISAGRWASREQRVFHKNWPVGRGEARVLQFFGKRYILAKAKHLLGILAIAGVL